MKVANDTPLVSIIIPVYNGSEYMREAIDSALAQTYSNIEVIVVNDGSNDGGETERIALSYGDKIKYIKKDNGGVSSALNVGIKNMNGEYFSWLSHDDLYLPEKISSQIFEINKINNKRVICICDSKQIDENSKELISKKCGSIQKISGRIGWKKALHLVITQGSFGGCNFLIPKEALVNAGGFNETMRYTQDFYMWIKIFLAGWDLLKVNSVQVCSRVHDKQVTVTGKEFFYKDCNLMGELLLKELLMKSDFEFNYIKDFALYNAKYCNSDVVNKYVDIGRKKNIISCYDVVYIRIMEVFGLIRPYLRSGYYTFLKIFAKILLKGN